MVGVYRLLHSLHDSVQLADVGGDRDNDTTFRQTPAEDRHNIRRAHRAGMDRGVYCLFILTKIRHRDAGGAHYKISAILETFR